MKPAVGWLFSFAILAAVGVTIYMNLDLKSGGRPAVSSRSSAAGPETESQSTSAQPGAKAAPFREEIIGEEVREAESLEIAAVYFPAVPMEGMDVPSGEHALHVEADVRATESNPNGFALGQFIPYMKLQYEISPRDGGETLSGDLVPMVARDGLHYGTTIVLPGPGKYRITYKVSPPSSGGLGRHDDPVTGVAPWWKPFQVSWDWDYQPREQQVSAGTP